MKKVIISILSLFSLASYSQQASFNAKIDGWGNDTIIVILFSWSGGDEVFDTIVARNGHASYSLSGRDTISIEMTSQRSLVPRRGGPYAPASMSISTTMLPGSKEKIVGRLTPRALQYKSKGSIPYFSQASDLRSLYLPYDIAADSLEKLIITASESGLSPEAENALFAERKRNYDQIRRVKLEYARKYPNEDIAALCVASQTLQNFNESLAILTPSSRDGLFKKRLDAMSLRVAQYERHLEAKKSVTVGSIAPDFKLPSLKGEELSLENFKGRWMLLDFWGSWCGWCIKGFPDMKKSYEKHKDRMEIVGIACRDTPEKWRAAIEKYQLPWAHLINLDQSVENISTRYAIEGYPTKILVSPEGRIVEICVGEDPEFYKKLDTILGSDN